ncbi:DNA glycosylase AlkZ-like family protein [Streptococcus orisratti]|uniref:DNA glycosylase AlkZ-like family protein n=1 Tax=Streptococcus orisratti TaxID=114652 RepID=UPI00294353EF|nr:crosslink repair DNA glycosylase YcaQ family protein [Streptococcus orisratti]
MKNITRLDILAQRFYNQGFIEPYQEINQLLQDSLGIQAQYLNHGLFNIANRMNLTKYDRIENSIADSILAWGQRQTYHFYEFETWQSICHFLAREKLWVVSYFQDENLNLLEESQQLKSYLSQPQTRSQLVDIYGKRWAKLFNWSALFLYNSRQGSLYQKWLPKDRLVCWSNQKSVSSPQLSRNLLEAYFTFYGPASLADAAHFFGISQTCLDHRELHNLRSFDYFGRSYYYKVWQNGANIPELLILGKFDPLLVSYKYKELLIAPDDQPFIWKKAGQISALILIKGQLRATWSMSVKGSAIDFKVQAKQKISQKHQASIRRNFRNYARWMGKKMRKVNFELE